MALANGKAWRSFSRQGYDGRGCALFRCSIKDVLAYKSDRDFRMVGRSSPVSQSISRHVFLGMDLIPLLLLHERSEGTPQRA